MTKTSPETVLCLSYYTDAEKAKMDFDILKRKGQKSFSLKYKDLLKDGTDTHVQAA